MFCENNLKDIIKINYDKLLIDITNKNKNIITKITNYIKRYDLEYSIDNVINEIKTNKMFAMFFIKDPKKQNFYENNQYNYISKYIPDLSISRNIYFDNGNVVSKKKSIHTTKSIDFISKKYKLLIAAKHIEDNGGSQDNQFKDLISFASEFPKIINSDFKYYKLVLLVSGQYFTQKIKQLQQICVKNVYIVNLNENHLNFQDILTIDMSKRELGQFFTTNQTILKNLELSGNGLKIIEPFVGRGDLIPLCEKYNLPLELYDIDTSNFTYSDKYNIICRDTLLDPLNYDNAFVITNPPYLAKNKTKDKQIFNKYNENDLYKCFIKCLINSNIVGGIIIIPLNFWCCVRVSDIKLKDDFLSIFTINHLNIFTKSVFNDTSYTVCSFSFVRQPSISQIIPTTMDENTFSLNLKKSEKWIICYKIFNTPQDKQIKFKRIINKIDPPDNMSVSNFVLKALDSNGVEKIKLMVVDINDIYIGKVSSRTEASFYWNLTLSKKQQYLIADLFNNYLNSKRKKFSSLFLSNYREGNRKRLGFNLAIHILNTIVSRFLNNIEKNEL